MNEFDIDIRMMAIADIDTNDYNPNAMEQETFDILTDTIREEGMNQPILVRQVVNPAEGQAPFEVVDGEHRFKAASLAGYEKIAVVVVPYDDDTAKIRTISMNQIRGEYIPLKMARLLSDLLDRHSEKEIARMTGIKKDEFQSLSQLLEVPDINFDDAPAITSEAVERPIPVNILLMPDEHRPYEEAMLAAMELNGPAVVPLLGEEVGQYDKAMTTTMGVTGTKLRNVALSTICKVFNAIPKDQQQAIFEELESDD